MAKKTEKKPSKRHYPECAKQLEAKEEAAALSAFWDWLHANGFSVCEYVEQKKTYEGGYHHPTHKSPETILQQYFSIDAVKLEKERQHMLGNMDTD